MTFFATLYANATVKAAFGDNPLRVFPFASAPDRPVLPYSTFSMISGQPENKLDGVPSVDQIGVQFDVWAKTSADATAGFTAIRDALEPIGYMTSFAQAEKDTETGLYHARLEFDFIQQR